MTPSLRPRTVSASSVPIGIAIGVVLCAYAVLSLSTSFYRSYTRHIDHTAAVHADRRNQCYENFETMFGRIFECRHQRRAECAR